MTTYHVAVDHLGPDDTEPITTYLGTCDQAHADEVRALASLETSERWVKEHPRQEGSFCVLRDDGDLDVYVPVDAAECRVYEPDAMPKTRNEGGDLVPDNAQFVQTKSTGSQTDEDFSPRGASGPAYISGVTKFGSQSIGGTMDTPGNPPRFTWHTTESPAGASYFTSIAAYLIRVGAEPQVIYDPVSDKLGQFGPLNRSGRALRNDGSRRTNREGKVNIQVEVLGRAKSPWTKGFDPAKKPNFRKLIAAGRAHGVPDVWPAGKPPATAAAATKRDRSTWQSKGGHFGHSQVPGNDHWDPGGIDTSVVPGKESGGGTPTPPAPPVSTTKTHTVVKGDTLTSIAKKYKTTVAALVKLNGLPDPNELKLGQKLKVPGTAAAPKPVYEPFPGSAFFHTGRTSPIVTALGRRLVALGFGKHYSSGPGPSWTLADRRNVADFQRSKPELAGAADGIPGPKTWELLKVPKLL